MIHVVDTLPPFCYPIDYTIDRNELTASLNILSNRLRFNQRNSAFNLTHLPELTGKDRWNLHAGSHRFLVEAGVNELNFTELLEEVKDLYLGKIIQDLYKQHNGPFQGRCQISIQPPKSNYGPHIDKHTSSRYHIPLITNANCYWKFYKDNEIYKLHMPADNKVWYVDSVNIKHDFHNDWDNYRWHLILANSII